MPLSEVSLFPSIFTNEKGCDKIYLKKNQKKEVRDEFNSKEK